VKHRPKISKAIKGVLKREGRKAASPDALSRQGRSAASHRSPSERSAAAKKAARTKGLHRPIACRQKSRAHKSRRMSGPARFIKSPIRSSSKSNVPVS
jgi:hypothetical protein